MRTKVETITPKKAQEMLDKHWVKDRQRKPSKNTVETYARVMRAGQWLLTHQGIAINDKGELLDGLHRLLAVVSSAVTVQMVVSYDVPDNGSVKGIYAIDAIDRGRLRGVGEQLTLRHGIKNGNLVAAVSRGILWLCAYSRGIVLGKTDVPNVLNVLDFYGKEIEHCVSMRSQDRALRNMAVISASAFALHAHPQQIAEFYEQLTTGEGIRSGDPALTCRRWMSNYYTIASIGNRLVMYRALLTCAMKFVQRERINKIFDSQHGYNFFLENQGRTVEKLLAACGFGERVL